MIGVLDMAKYNERTGFMEYPDDIPYEHSSFIDGKHGGDADYVGHVPQPGEMYLIALPDVGGTTYLNTSLYSYPVAPKTYICKVCDIKYDTSTSCLVNYDCSLKTPEEYGEFYKFILADLTGEHVIGKEEYSSVQFFLPFENTQPISFGTLAYTHGFITRERRLKSMSMIMIRIK